MRLIKFRIWDEQQRAFLDGVYLPQKHHFEWSRFKVQQYTGLKDKNGVAIYEGDIVKCDLYKDNPETAIVKYSDHFLRWHLFFVGEYREHLKNKRGIYIFDWIYPDVEIKIIGNTYENPELTN